MISSAMSSPISWLIIILVVGNIIGVVWLLFATNRPNDISEDSTMGHRWDGIEELNSPLPRWWLWLFIITVIFGVVYLYLYPGLGAYQGSLGWTQQGQYEEARVANAKKQRANLAAFIDQDIPELAKNPTAMATAGRLFANNCSTCHGSDAKGAKGFPNLTDSDWLYGGNPDSLLETIKNGRNGNMPNLGLSALNASLLASYVVSLSGREVPEHPRTEGAKLFGVCAGCHGQNGTGNQALGAPNLTDDIWLHGGSISDIEAVLLNGKQNRMPAFADLLNPDEIRLLAAYVLSVQSNNNTQ